MKQEPSKDEKAPNMENGKVKLGEIKFIYSDYAIDYEELKKNKVFEEWKFEDSKNTKELDLTHNLIAARAGFGNLMEIYDKDPILQLKRELMKEINDDDIIDENATFEEIISRYPKINNKVLLIKGDEKKNKLFNMIKDQPFIKIKKMYFSKDSLIDDKKLSSEEVERKGRKRDSLISQLFKIQKLIKLYDYKKYNEFIKIID